MVFPESEDVVARFILDHSADLDALAADDPPRLTADVLIGLGLRRSRAVPRPSALERRLASWRRLHGARNLAGPFGSPALRSLLARARAAGRAVHGHAAKKSANPVDRDILDRLVAARAPGLHGLRDVALIETAWATGGRRRSELAGLRIEDLDRSAFEADGTITLRLRETKTHKKAPPLPLLLTGRAARGRPLQFFMTAGQVSDYTGAAALLSSLPTADWLIADRAMTPPGSEQHCGTRG